MVPGSNPFEPLGLWSHQNLIMLSLVRGPSNLDILCNGPWSLKPFGQYTISELPTPLQFAPLKQKKVITFLSSSIFYSPLII